MGAVTHEAAPPELPTPDHAREAQQWLADVLRPTPVLGSPLLDDALGVVVHAKSECLQVTGSFKVRGALNRVRTLSDEARSRGLLTVSAGNAAIGTAFAAQRCGAELTVVMPSMAVPEKVAAVRRYGAHVVQDGVRDAAAAFECANELQRAQGLTFVHPFDDPMVIAGAATATLELLEEAPHLAAIYVPCSGGGLLAGATLAVRAAGSATSVIGVQPDGNAGFVLSLRAGTPTAPAEIDTVADGLTAPRPGDIPFRMVAEAGVRIVTVSDEQILRALPELVTWLRVVVEPSAAAALAGALNDPLRPDGPIGLLLTGGNVRRSMLAGSLSSPA